MSGGALVIAGVAGLVAMPDAGRGLWLAGVLLVNVLRSTVLRSE